MTPVHTHFLVRWSAVLLLCLAAASIAPNAFAQVGTIQFVAGDVRIIDAAGRERPARRGDAINEGDTILTGGGVSSAQLKMVDAGIIAVRPDTRLKIDQYIYKDREDGTERALMSLLKGGFRTITGIIGRTNKQNYLVATPTATIGIRGTDHEAFFIPPVTAAVKPPAPPGAYDKVNVGIAFIRSPLGEVNILQNQVGYAAPDKPPVLLPVVPDFFKATPPIRAAEKPKPGVAVAEAPVREEAVVDTQPPAPPPPVAPPPVYVAPPPQIQPLPVIPPQPDVTFAAEAQIAAKAALASATALNSLVTSLGSLSSVAVPTVLGAATPEVTAADTAVQLLVTSALALTLNTTTATSNASSSASLAATAQSQTTAALAAFTANGSFADSTAVTAKSALEAANNTLQTANTTIQSNLTTVTTSGTSFTTAQQAAKAALASATAALSQANAVSSTLTTLGLQNSTASAQLTLAQSAASAAQAEATAALNDQNAGNLTGAEQHLLSAQQQAAIAAAALSVGSQIGSGVTSGNTASSQAATASTEASNAQTAASTGTAAASTISSTIGTVSTNAPVVTTNAPLAAFNNPAVASTNFSHVVSSQAPVASTIRSFMGEIMPTPNTNYVLDGNKDLVEIRSTTFEGPGPTDNINDVDVRFSGGVARDHFQAPDNTVYMGRIQGGQIDVTSGGSPLFTRQLGPTSAHWLIGLMPGSSSFSTTLGPINNVQTLVGTANYTLTAATRPTDSFGNVGTLSSASLTANFSSQTVSTALQLSFSPSDLVNISSRDLHIDASAANVPIVREGGPLNSLFFETGSSRFPLSVTCTGQHCAPGGYVGEIGGGFGASASGGTTTGAVGTGVGLGYGFVPAPGANTDNGPDADFIHGVAVLNTTTAPVTGVINNFPDNTRVRHEALYSTSAVGSTDTFTVRARDTINLETPTPATLSGPRVNTNYLFDASGNLVRIFDTPYVIFDHAKDLATTTQFAAPTPLAHAQVSFGGGGSVPAELFNFTPTGGTDPIIRMGRWQGGFVNVMDLQPPAGFILPGFIDSLVSPIGGGSRSVHWLVRQGVPIIPTTGVFHYVRIPDAAGNNSFATSPTDSYGNVGTLDRAQLTADFTRMTVSAGLAVTIRSGAGGLLGIQNLSGNFADAPLQSGGFSVSSNPANNPPNTDKFNINCFGAGCAPNQTYGGRVRGAFAGLNAEGAFYRYTFHTGYDPVTNPAPAGRVNDDYIDGLVAFGKGPEIVTPPLTHPEGPSEVLAAYTFPLPFIGECFGQCVQSRTQSFFVENPANLTLDPSGNLVSVFDPAEAGEDHNDSLTLTGGTASPPSPISAGNGITLGWWSPPLTVSGEDFDGTFTNRTVQGDGLAWVRGPAVFPWYLPGAIATISNSGGTVVTGTASFNLTGSIVRDQNGLGAIGPVTAGLLANFNRAAVGFDMTIPTTAGTWAAFNNGTTHSGTIVANIRMELEGSFHAFTGTEDTTPPGINTHRRMTVTLNGSPGFGNVQGQLMGPGVNGAGMTYTFFSGSSTDRVLGALAFNNPTPFSAETPYHLVGAASGMNSLGQFDEEENTPIRGGVVSRSRMDFVDGLPVRVDLGFPVAAIPTGCTSCTTNVNEIPAVFAVTGATATGTGFTSISIGNAQIFDSGIDPTTGIRWGRYGGPGSAANAIIGVTDRINGAVLPSIDVGPTTQGVHFIATGTQSGPVVLPISGTFSYTKVGNTMPTDNFGNTGILNSATLTANFTAKTVSSTVNLTVAGATWDASASNMPIQRGTFFEAAKNLDGTGNLAVTRNNSGTGTAGRLVGGFGGQTGTGAGVLYSLNQGGNNTATNPSATTVSGVAAFKR